MDLIEKAEYEVKHFGCISKKTGIGLIEKIKRLESFKPQQKQVLRGGSWFFYAGDACSAFRYVISPSARFDCYGFRLVLKVEN